MGKQLTDRITLKRVCKEAGVRITHQRLEIYREIMQSDDHPNAETVYARIKERIPTISLDTVYRTLWLFRDLKLIKTLEASRGSTRFEPNLTHHHHFVCNECGRIQDFNHDEFDEMTLPVCVTKLGQVSTTQIEARGICRNCMEKLMNHSDREGNDNE